MKILAISNDELEADGKIQQQLDSRSVKVDINEQGRGIEKNSFEGLRTNNSWINCKYIIISVFISLICFTSPLLFILLPSKPYIGCIAFVIGFVPLFVGFQKWVFECSNCDCNVFFLHHIDCLYYYTNLTTSTNVIKTTLYEVNVEYLHGI